MTSKVLILTAGKGSRLDQRTKYFNKALLRVGNKAVISHTIDQFDNETEFVIALGYKGDIVRQYLEIAHPEKKFTFVEIDKYSEPNSGPGYAVKLCKEHLQCPFYFYSCDSIIKFKLLSEVKGNWAAFDYIDKKESHKYCTVQVRHNKIESFFDKQENSSNQAFVGVAFIQDYKEFWQKLDQEIPTANQEIQIAPSILSLKNVYPLWVTWFDTGSEEGLLAARQHFEGIQNLDKLDEELYVVNNNVVKYFHNSNIVQNRVERTKIMGDTVPKLIQYSKNFYKYRFVEGQDLFKLSNPETIMFDLLNYANENLWQKKVELNELDLKIFKDVCKKFYYDKTMMRLEKLYSKLNIEDKREVINNQQTLSVAELFQKINWDWLSDESPSGFHGDFNFSNILYGPNGFKFLDWRQEFGGFIECGGKNYDFSKLYHSFLFPHPSVKENKYYIEKRSESYKTFIETPIHIERCKDIFEQWIIDNGYDLHKVKILTAIVLVNMSPLHESPIDEYLYYFAKHYLHEVLHENQ